MADENKNGVPDELDKAAAVGRFIAKNWFVLIIAVIALGGTTTMFATGDEVINGVCKNRVALAVSEAVVTQTQLLNKYEQMHVCYMTAAAMMGIDAEACESFLKGE